MAALVALNCAANATVMLPTEYNVKRTGALWTQFDIFVVDPGHNVLFMLSSLSRFVR